MMTTNPTTATMLGWRRCCCGNCNRCPVDRRSCPPIEAVVVDDVGGGELAAAAAAEDVVVQGDSQSVDEVGAAAAVAAAAAGDDDSTRPAKGSASSFLGTLSRRGLCV